VTLFGLVPLSAAARPLAGAPSAVVTNALSQDGVAVLDGAGADRDLAGVNPRDYMTVTVNLDRPSPVRVSFTGYAFAKSSGVGVQTPGCPCLVRGELRMNEDAKQIVTRTVLATTAADIVGDPNATPPVAAADRRDISGSHVFSAPAGTHTFTMSLFREVGTAENVGFAFGRMQAEALPTLAQEAVTVLDGAGADRDLAGVNPKDYMTVTVDAPQLSLVRVSFTGYAFAKSGAVGTQTPGCPCLVRGELRANDGPKQIVTRTVVSSTGADIVGDPGAAPPVAAADRRDFSGSHVFSVPAGRHAFTMSMQREVGSADNVGFAFGRMQAELMPNLTADAAVTLDGAGADRDLAGVNPKDYMTTTVTVAQPSLVRVSFTGYAFAKSSGVGAQTPGCPCLVRGELRQGDGPKQIVTRTVLATDANDIVGDPAAMPAVAAADRRDISGSHVFAVPAGSHTFTMSLMREVGAADNVGFAFGRMIAEASPVGGAPMPSMPRTGSGAGAAPDADLSWLSVAGAGVLAAAVAIALRRRRRA
jgi:hypothetical protein